MKSDTALPVKALKNKASVVISHSSPNNNLSREASPYWKWLFASFTLIIVPTCQSMPSEITIINDKRVQNIQMISIKNEEGKK